MSLAPPLSAQISLAPPLEMRLRPSSWVLTPPRRLVSAPGLSPCSLLCRASVVSCMVPGQTQRVEGALRNIMQFQRGRGRSRSRSRELYLQEQSLKVAALNGQRMGKGRREH